MAYIGFREIINWRQGSVLRTVFEPHSWNECLIVLLQKDSEAMQLDLKPDLEIKSNCTLTINWEWLHNTDNTTFNEQMQGRVGKPVFNFGFFCAKPPQMIFNAGVLYLGVQ